MFNKLVKLLFLMALTSAVFVFTGCDDEEMAGGSLPAAEPVDLTQTEDLFSQPIMADPAATDPAAVLVRVNGEEITRGDVQQELDLALRQFGGQIPPQQLQQMEASMRQRITDSLITRTLLDAAVTAAGITATAEELSEALEEIKASVPPGQDFETALAASGTTMEELTANIREQMTIRKLLESKTEGIEEVTEEEAKEFYDTNPDQFTRPEGVSASHILIMVDPSDTEETKMEKKAKLEKIRADIIAGTVTFEDAAKANSDCNSKEQGGSLGTFGKGQMVPEFETAAFSQEVGEVGDVVETQFGYHIIKVDGHSEEGTVSFDEAKEQIISVLTNQKKQAAVGEYIQGLRDSATIEIVTPE